MRQDGISFDTKRHVKILVVWSVITVLSAVTIIALFVTLPVLAALLAELFVRPRTTASALLAWALGPMLMIGAGWFLLRVDEVPGEGPPSAGLTVVAIVGLVLLRRYNMRADASQGLLTEH